MQKGRYCPGEEGECVIFYVQEKPARDESRYIFYFPIPVPHIVSLFEYKEPYHQGDFLTVTKESYENLVKVIGTDKEWTNVVNALPEIGNVNPQTIPGTWSWLSEHETETFNKGMDGAVGNMPKYSPRPARSVMTGIPGGSSRKSKRIHRKPTKRRRNRRGNRKTKKN
jgi:hypothetical protein